MTYHDYIVTYKKVIDKRKDGHTVKTICRDLCISPRNCAKIISEGAKKGLCSDLLFEVGYSIGNLIKYN